MLVQRRDDEERFRGILPPFVRVNVTVVLVRLVPYPSVRFGLSCVVPDVSVNF